MYLIILRIDLENHEFLLILTGNDRINAVGRNRTDIFGGVQLNGGALPVDLLYPVFMAIQNSALRFLELVDHIGKIRIDEKLGTQHPCIGKIQLIFRHHFHIRIVNGHEVQVTVIFIYQHFPVHSPNDLKIEGAGIIPVRLRISDLLGNSMETGKQQAGDDQVNLLFSFPGENLMFQMYEKISRTLPSFRLTVLNLHLHLLNISRSKQ